MWIKLIITIITLFLLFDEYLKVTDKVKKRNRRKMVLFVLAILSIFSLIDVIIEVNDGNALVNKANEIIIKSDTLISNTNTIIADLEDNIEVVEESGKSIIAIDSVLRGVRDSVSSQVEILKEAAGKSAELVRLEEKKFMQDEARIEVYSSDIELVTNKSDSSFFDIKINFRNLGKRRAKDVKFENKLLLYNSILGDFKVFDFRINYFTNGIAVNSIGTSSSVIPWGKLDLEKKYNMLILIINGSYRDVVSNNHLIYKEHFKTLEVQNEKTKFVFVEGFYLTNKINDFLVENKLDDYLIEKYSNLNK